MTTPPPDTAQIARLRALFALDKLSPDLLSAVLADGELERKLGLTVTALPLQLGPESTIAREDLFTAFAELAEGGGSVKLAIVDKGQPVEATVSLDAQGAALVETAHLKVQFAHAALWATDRERRRAMLASELQTHSLAQGLIGQLNALILSDMAPNYEGFRRATDILNASPEIFAATLEAKLPGGRLTEGDLLPVDPSYWDNLTAAWHGSCTLPEFISNELRAEREARRTANPPLSYAALSVQFTGQELVPHEWLLQWHVDEVIQLVEFLRRCEDHISLAAAFEICARQLKRDQRFVMFGEQLLERLFADPEVLLARCQRYAAAFVLATARLALHERTRSLPVFWRRSAAAAHAVLVARTLGHGQFGGEELLDWAMERRGEYFFLSIYRELAESPRWQPEYLDPDSLMADALGRIQQALYALPAAEVPPTWQERIAGIQSWIDGRGLAARTWLPSPTQGNIVPQDALIPQVLKDHAAQLFAELKAQPTPENLLRLSHATELAGVPGGSGAEIRLALEVIFDGSGPETKLVETVLAVSARMALLSQDAALAEAVAERVFDRALHSPETVRVVEVIVRLLQCVAAEPERALALDRLANRFERLALAWPSGEDQDRLLGCLRKLQHLDEAHAPLWGRAANIAKLGMTPRKTSITTD